MENESLYPVGLGRKDLRVKRPRTPGAYPVGLGLSDLIEMMDEIKSKLVCSDPKLGILFNKVDSTGVNIFESQKKPYPSPIGAID